jgi:hypothetical protein
MVSGGLKEDRGVWLIAGLLLAVLLMAACAGTPEPVISTTTRPPVMIPTLLPTVMPVPISPPASQAMLSAIVDLKRSAGQGSCGIAPWRDVNCIEPKNWWGLKLKSSITIPMLVYSETPGKWVITNNPDSVARYGLDVAQFTQSSGTYQTAEVDFGKQSDECRGSIKVEPFSLQVLGTRSDKIQMHLSTDLAEMILATCGEKTIESRQRALLNGWGAALTGDPNDLTLFFDEADYVAGELIYRKQAEIRTNPSPDMRDSVQAEMTFWCVDSNDPKRAAQCPWY